MRKFLRSKIFISLILLALAFILTFVMIPKIYGKQAETMTVVQFTKDVNLGTVITSEMLKTNTIGSYGVNRGVITNPEEVIGKYAARNISAKEYLYSEMFTDTFEEVEGASINLVKPGQHLVTVRLADGSGAVGGLVKPGDTVNILTQVRKAAQYDEYGMVYGDEKLEMELTELLTGVTVYKLQNEAYEDITQLNRKWQAELENGTKETDKSDTNALIPVYVTLIVTDDQAKVLAEQTYDGTIHMILCPNIKAGSAAATYTPAPAVPMPEATPEEPTAEPDSTEDQQPAA